MMNALPKTFEDLTAALAAADRGNLQLDQALWHWEKNRPEPIPGFEEASYKQAYNAGSPGASMSTNPASLLHVLESTYAQTRVSTRAEGGLALASVQILGLGMPITGEIKRRVQPSQIGLVLAAAFCEAHERAHAMTLRLREVAGLKESVLPGAEWPIERKGDKFFAVLHEHRLLGEGFGSAELASKNAAMLRIEDSVMLMCRSRYDNFFGKPKIEQDSPSLEF